MLGIKGIIFALACITQLYIIDAVTNVDHEPLDIDGKELIFNDESLKDGKLTFASCTKNKESKERQCKVAREKTPFSNDYSTCDVKIKFKNRKTDSDMDGDKLSIIPFAENKAVLYLIDNVKNGATQFNTIDLDTCKVTTYEMSIIDPTNEHDRMILVPYKDSFDLFSLVHDISKKHYITKFDSEGQKQDLPLGPTPAETYSSDVVRIVPISESRDKGTLYVEHIKDSNNEYDLIIRKLDGTNISLGKRTIYEPMALATNEDLIGICFKMYDTHPEFNCTQNDLSDEEKFNINPLEKNNDTAVLAVHNLPKGGMLILVGSCDEPMCSFYEVNFSVIKIDSMGETVGTAHIGKTKAVSESNEVEMSLSFHKNKDQSNCISIDNYVRDKDPCDEKNKDKKGCRFSATDYCFTDTDFKK